FLDSPAEFRVLPQQTLVRGTEVVDQLRLLEGRRELVGDESEEPPFLLLELPGHVEIEAERATGIATAVQRQGDHRHEAQLARRLPPVSQREIGEDVRDRDRLAVGDRSRRRAAPDPDAQLAEIPCRGLRPVLRTDQPQQLAVGRLSDEYRTEAR